jgi:hypothetical protein
MHEQLVHQTALPDTRLADQGDELRLVLVTRPVERVSQERQLAIAPDERGVDPPGDVDAIA